MNEDLEVYKENMKKLYELEASDQFSNSNTAHARAILETFFELAKDKVCIFCESLHAEFYDSLKDDIQAALARGVKIEIISQEEACSIKVCEIKDKNFAISKTENQGVRDLDFNFAVMDNTSFRFEDNKENHKATVSMYDEKITGDLIKHFNSIKALA